MALQKKMRAAQVVALGQPLVIREIDVPEPKHGELLLKVEMCGVCHTDLHVKEGDWDVKCTPPRTLGHEVVGKVVELGPGVTNVAIGDRVCIPWMGSTCLACEYCWTGWETVCLKQQRTGFSVDGGFAEYCKANACFVGKIPDALSFEQAAPISCAGVTVYKGLKESEVKPNQFVSIIGAAGGLGHLAIQYAKAMGMKVIGIDFGAGKVEYMQKLGADFAIDVSTGVNLIDEVKKISGGGVHGALILVPKDVAVAEAVKYVRPTGVVVLIAIPPGSFSGSYLDTILNRITIRGSIVGTRQDLQEALELAAEGKVKCDVHKYKFAQVNDVMKDLAAGKVTGRCVLEM